MPRILLQQGTNLVNKFALLLHKCRFAQDSRDKPENDGSWRCWLSICCSNFINYPSPDTTVSTDKPSKGLDVVRQYAELLERRVQSSTRVRKAQVVTRQTKHIRNLLPQCASDATGFLSDMYKKSTRARKFLADGVQCGRSMIEMLGVLAIIAVLSVGGIAGYGKAMRMWNSYLQKEQISQLLHSFIRLRYELGNDKTASKKRYNTADILNALGEVPDGLTYKSGGFYDKSGNFYGGVYGTGCWKNAQDSDEETCAFQMNFYADLIKADSSLIPTSEDLCENMVYAAKEIAQDIDNITTYWYNTKDDNDPTHWRGYTQWTPFNYETIKTATPLQIKEMCRQCKNHSACTVSIHLKPN